MTPEKIEELRADIAFTQLTPKQQKFVEAFLQSGNSYSAVAVAYECADAHSIRAVVGQVTKNENVVALIERYQGSTFMPSKEAFLIMLLRELRRKGSKSEAKAELFKLYAKIAGYDQPTHSIAVETSDGSFLNKYDEEQTHE